MLDQNETPSKEDEIKNATETSEKELIKSVKEATNNIPKIKEKSKELKKRKEQIEKTIQIMEFVIKGEDKLNETEKEKISKFSDKEQKTYKSLQNVLRKIGLEKFKTRLEKVKDHTIIELDPIENPQNIEPSQKAKEAIEKASLGWYQKIWRGVKRFAGDVWDGICKIPQKIKDLANSKWGKRILIIGGIALSIAAVGALILWLMGGNLPVGNAKLFEAARGKIFELFKDLGIGDSFGSGFEKALS